MARHIRQTLVSAGSLAALSCMLLIAATHTGIAQSTQPSPQLGGASNAPSQHSAGASEFLKVPLVNNIPGGVKPQAQIQNPAAKDPAAPERGMKYFESFNCVGCHAPNGGGGMGLALSNRAFKYGSEPDRLFLVISHGAPLGMPAWGGVLPENVIWDLVAYIEGISKAPDTQWGTTVSPAINMPAIQQVPAQFKQTPTPWEFTEPFGNGQAPTASSSGAAGLAPPASGSSRQ